MVGEYFDNVYRVLNDYAIEFENVYKGKLDAENLKATHKLIDSVHCTIQTETDGYSVWLNVEDYFYYAEKGRGKGKFPPRDAIMKWIEAKPILPRPNAKGKLPTQKQLAFLIGRAIANKGTIKRFNYDGSKTLAKTIDEVNRKYMPLLQEALESDFYAYSIKIGEILSKIL